MEKPYWDLTKRRKIDRLRKIEPQKALSCYEEYISKYYSDYEAKLLYASTLITVGQISQAYEVIKETKYQYNNNRKIKADSDMKKYLDRSSIITEIRLYGYTEQFDKIYDILQKNNLLSDEQFSYIAFLSKVKLGMISEENLENLKSYKKKQGYEYSEDRFKEYIKKHTYEENHDKPIEEKSNTFFCEHFPLDRVIEEVKKNIDRDNCLYLGFFSDTYIFKYDCCGVYDNTKENYFKVVCSHDTNNIITMHPAPNCERLPYVDLNYINIDDNYERRRPSQTERFYKRFAKQ